MSLKPLSFTLQSPKLLRIAWSDGHESRFPLAFLRDECPCAGCKGEQGLFGVYYHPKPLPILTPEKYVLKAITPVGNYAVTMAWGDGHDTGLYSWQYLRDLDAVLVEAESVHETDPSPEATPTNGRSR